MENIDTTDNQKIRSRDGFRQHSEKLVAAAVHLAPNDRFLIEQIFGYGLPIVAIARQMNLHTNNLYRLAHKIVKRMNSSRFRFVAGHISILPKHLRSTAELAVLKGITQREITILTGKTLHQIRQELTMIDALNAF